MTKDEAIALMRKGEKITHQYFTPTEWVTMEGNKILLEDGVKCYPEEFWSWRTTECWNDGYSIYEETKS